jgi:hypothetical protein
LSGVILRAREQGELEDRMAEIESQIDRHSNEEVP